MDPIVIEPTSKDSATCDPIVLRQSKSVRLVFRPVLVNSDHDERHAVQGTFVYQKKRQSDEWEDVPADPLSKLKGGEGVKLEVKSEEVFRLFHYFIALYEFHRANGIPAAKTFVAPAEDGLLVPGQLIGLGDALQRVGVEDLEKILAWAVESSHSAMVVEQLGRLGVDDLQKLNVLVGVSGLKNALAMWEANRDNSKEEFWQQRLERNPFVLSQVFSQPVVILKGKAYVGGKGVEDDGGNVLDYLCANQLTRNALLVEIKTPCTPLLGPRYRGDVYNVSAELSGAVMQARNSKDSLLKSCHGLQANSAARFEAIDPPTLVIAGDTRQLTDGRRRKSFELFRTGLKDVEVIAFDELFAKVATLVSLLEGT